MNLCSIIHDVLGIPLSCIKIYSEDKALCLVHVSWIKFVTKGLKIPHEFLEDLVDEDLVSSVFPASDIKTSEWQFLVVHQWMKKEGKLFRFLKPHEKYPLSTLSLTYSQLIHYVTKTNYKNLWEQAWKKYHVTEGIKKNKNKQKYNEALHDILSRLYETEMKEREDGIILHICHQKIIGNSSKECDDAVNPNLLQLYCAIETKQYFYWCLKMLLAL